MRTQSQAKRKVNYKSTDRVFHAAVPPNPRLRRGLKKEWCLVARKTTLVVCNCVWQLTPLYSKVDQGESAAEGGIPPPSISRSLEATLRSGGGYATWHLQNFFTIQISAWERSFTSVFFMGT